MELIDHVIDDFKHDCFILGIFIDLSKGFVNVSH